MQKLRKDTPIFHSVIARKLTYRLSRRYYLLCLVILVLGAIFLFPVATRIADRDARNILVMMTDELDTAQTSVTDSAQTLLYFSELPALLSKQERAPSAQNRALIEQELSAFVGSQTFLLAATLEDMQHDLYTSVYYKPVVTQESLLTSPDYLQLFETRQGQLFSFVPDSLFHTDAEDYSYNTMRYCRVCFIGNRPYVLSTYYNLTTILRHCAALMGTLYQDFALLSHKDGIFYMQGESLAKEAERLASLFSYNRSVEGKRTKKGAYYYRSNPSTGWILLAYSPYFYYYRDFLLILGIIFVLYLVSPVFYNAFLVPTTSRMLSPIGELNEAMQHYSAGDTVRLELGDDDEIQQLSEVFQNMADRITRQIEDIHTQEHVNAVTNYKLMATQIDPHFIYNTMNIINIMAREGNTGAIVDINSALIRILRERLSTKLSISDTICNEMNTLHQYSLIMDYRYRSKVVLSGDVDPEIEDCLIPKNILQPLAENAFYHGFANLEEGRTGHIDIVIYAVDDEIVIEVSDDGIGMEPERLALIQNRSYRIYDDKKPHIGIDNIRQRLDYYYEGNYELTIHSTYGAGTTISITVPMEKPSH